MTRRLAPVAALIVGALAALTIISLVTFIVTGRPATVYAEGPCSMLGIAEVEGHPGVPLLVIDCEGFQFGVPAVLP